MKQQSSLNLAFHLLGLLVLSLCWGCPAEEPEVFHQVQFPSGFEFGTAIAQWQASGDYSPAGPVDSNWSQWAQMGKTHNGTLNPEGNGFYWKYESDVALAKNLGLKVFRIGVDWSRIEPEAGVYDEAELDHLADVVKSIYDAGMKPVLTLYHWTVPTWVQNPNPNSDMGTIDLMATTDRAVVDYFEGFVRQVIPRVKDWVDTYTVLNEPFSMISAGYIGGVFPPGKYLDFDGGTQFGINLLYMYARAYDVIKELDDGDGDGDGANSFVGLTMTANAFYPEEPGNADEEFAVEQISYVFNDWIMIALTEGKLDVDLDRRYDNMQTTPPEGIDENLKGKLEFVGVQYYGPVMVDDVSWLVETPPLYGLPLLEVDEYDADLPHNGMKREISAAGFRDTLDIYAPYGVPMIITENGTTSNGPAIDTAEGQTLGDNQEAQAAMFLVEHLWEVGKAIEDGMDIRGYYQWTLADNFEWVEGHLQRFGAYRVDFDDPEYARTKTLLADALKDVVGQMGVTESIWEKYVLDHYPSDQTGQSGPTTSLNPVPTP